MISPPPLSPAVQASSVMAALAYTSSTETLVKQLADPALPLGKVELAWGPQEKESNRAYVAKVLQGEKPRYVVAIRGTVVDLESLFENLELSLVQLPWKTRRYKEARIREGVAEAVQHLQSLRSGPRKESLLTFLESTEDDASIVVTGHSQGGCIASVLSLWIHEAMGGSGRQVIPHTFAAQTAGPTAFANAVNTTFDDGCRFYNQLDVVPRTWAESSLATIADLFPGNGPKCNWLFRQLVKAAEDCASGKGFEQPSRAQALPGQLYDERGLFAFGKEMAVQHEALLYVWLTGVSLSAIRVIDPKWRPPPHP